MKINFLKYPVGNLRIISVFCCILIFFSVNSALAAFSINDFKNTSGLDTTAKGSGYTTEANPDPGQVLTKVIETFLTFLGVLFLGLMIYGGFTWMTAKGNQQKVDKAKSIITNSIIGLVVIMAAYGLTMYIANYLVASG